MHTAYFCAGYTEQLSSTSRHATNNRGLALLFNWNPGSLVGRKCPFQKHPLQATAKLKEFSKLAMDNIEILDDCGFSKPITRFKHKPDLVQAVPLHRVLLKSLAETT